VAVDVREPGLSEADRIRREFEAKAGAELHDADGLVGASVGSWEGPLLGARVAFLVARPSEASGAGALLAEPVRDAVLKAADALGAGEDVFVAVTRPQGVTDTEAAARRLRLLIEAVDPPVVIALDAEAASDLALAFGAGDLRPGHPVRALGRGLGATGDFAASLDDPDAKKRAWSAMKGAAALGGLVATVRPSSLGDAGTGA
jgi:hypothetical protein